MCLSLVALDENTVRAGRRVSATFLHCRRGGCWVPPRISVRDPDFSSTGLVLSPLYPFYRNLFFFLPWEVLSQACCRRQLNRYLEWVREIPNSIEGSLERPFFPTDDLFIWKECWLHFCVITIVEPASSGTLPFFHRCFCGSRLQQYVN